MIDLESIRKHARQSLVIIDGDGKEDVYLWEHSLRVLATAQMLSQTPEVKEAVDHAVLATAALFHEAGWAVDYAGGRLPRETILERLTSSVQYELAAGLMEEKLHDVLPKSILIPAAQCVRMMADRRTEMVEGKLILEADNLDMFGVAAICQSVRKQAGDGKGFEALIETWQARREYGYWEARIKDSFTLEPSRRIARRRVEVFDRIMEEVRLHHTGEDVLLALEGNVLPAV